MSLRDRIHNLVEAGGESKLFGRYGILSNPFPSSNQTSDNPHLPHGKADETAEIKIASFIHDNRSQAVVVEGTQGVGKTNFLNYFEAEIRKVSGELQGYYVVRYLANPEESFDGTVRQLFQELGVVHLQRLAATLQIDKSHIDKARNQDVRTALLRLAQSDLNVSDLMLDWLLGHRLLKAHRETVGVQFRLDTVESKTAALRDVVEVSASAGILNGVFLLLDELEKQDGVLGPRAVVRYLSAVRAIIDALPRRLFLMMAVTPDALRRYSVALPALRGRLQNRIELSPLMNVEDAVSLAEFYLKSARNLAASTQSTRGGESEMLSEEQVKQCYNEGRQLAERRGDEGVRQREFLHGLHELAEKVISSTVR